MDDWELEVKRRFRRPAHYATLLREMTKDGMDEDEAKSILLDAARRRSENLRFVALGVGFIGVCICIFSVIFIEVLDRFLWRAHLGVLLLGGVVTGIAIERLLKANSFAGVERRAATRGGGRRR